MTQQNSKPLQYLLTLFVFLVNNVAFSQSILSGNIFDKKSNKPLSNVSISILKKNIGALSDVKGHFSMPISRLKKTDTLLLSSIGYSTLKLPISEAERVNDFYLSEESKDLEDVVIRTYTNEASEGSTSEVTGFFRSWTTKRNGGEIGRMIYVNSDDYKVERIRFKTNNQCDDTCIVRLHIRDMHNGLPDADLLKDSMSIVLSRTSFDDKYAEFDLRDKNVVIKKNKYVLVSLETLHCNNADSSICSLCYIGTEKGTFMYRTKDYRQWEESAEHSLYLKMYYKF